MPKFTHPPSYSKELAPSTQKIYSSKLNRLAAAGFDTVEKVLAAPKKVIEAIEAAAPGDSETAKHVRRYFLSALFWVLPEKYMKKTNPFHKYYQKVLPSKVVGTDAKWVKKANYAEDEA